MNDGRAPREYDIPTELVKADTEQTVEINEWMKGGSNIKNTKNRWSHQARHWRAITLLPTHSVKVSF
jgi:hypothetical protein